MIVAIDHVQLAAPPGCEAAARAFYGSVLGLEEVEKPAPLKARGGCWFQCGSQQLHIGIARDFKPATKAHPAFAVTDLDILRTALTAVGAPVIADENHPGTCRFYTEDPWGNRLEFLESDRGMRKVEG